MLISEEVHPGAKGWIRIGNTRECKKVPKSNLDERHLNIFSKVIQCSFHSFAERPAGLTRFLLSFF